MADLPSREQRHLDLWREREPRLAKLLFATLLFGLLAAWKVVAPSLANAHEHAASRRALADATAERAELLPRTQALARLSAALREIEQALATEPWRGGMETLKSELKRYAVLRNEVLANVDAARQWVAEPHVATVQGELHDGLADMQLLELDGAAAKAATPAEFRKSFETAFGVAVARAATRAVDAITRNAHEHVAAPLERATAEAEGAGLDLGPFTAATQSFDTRLNRWREDHLGERSWYESVAGKEQELSGLAQLLDGWRRELTTHLTPQVERAAAADAALAAQTKRLEQALADAATRQTQLRSSVAELLPDWIRGLVSPEELVRAYPFALAGLALLVGLAAALARHHFIRCRDALYPDGTARRDPALSSLWTLVFRGCRGTFWTTAAYAVAVALWFACMRLGVSSATDAWNDPFFGDPPFSASWLIVPRLVQWLVPAGAAIGIAAAWRDARAA